MGRGGILAASQRGRYPLAFKHRILTRRSLWTVSAALPLAAGSLRSSASSGGCHRVDTYSVGGNHHRFLLGLGVYGGAALLAACSSPSAPAPQAAPSTAAPKAAAPTTAPAAPAAAPNTTASDAAFKAEWDKIVAAAQGEKTVSIATYSGGGHRKVMEAFQTAFPGVQVEHQQFQSSSRDYVPRLSF